MARDNWLSPMFISLLCFLTIFVLLQVTKFVKSSQDDEIIPQFPHLIESSGATKRQIKLVTESVGDKNGFQTHEEYVDFNKGKSAIVSTTKDGQKFKYLDAKSGYSYNYTSFDCTIMSIKDLRNDGEIDNWNYNLSIQVEDNKEAELRIYGVLGMWLFAEQQEKTFSSSQSITSVSKDVHRDSYCWTVTDSSNKFQFEFHFFKGEQKLHNRLPQMTLEMVQIISKESLRTIKTINILSIEYKIDDETSEDILEVPVGYGCINDLSPHDMAKRCGSDFENIMSDKASQIEFEITATDYKKSDKGVISRSSDTASVQLAQSEQNSRILKSIRVRNTDRDIKTVLNHMYKVRYTIDLRRGTCNMSHLGADDDMETDSVNFNNGLKMHILKNHRELFNSAMFMFKLVKETAATNRRPKQAYYEAQTPPHFWPDNRQATTRLIRTYTQVDNDRYVLSSVLVWVLDEHKSQIIQTYQINIVDMRYISGWPDEPKAFDISEECYLNDEKKRPGRDYAWVELTYPATGPTLDFISKDELGFKRTFYDLFFKNKLDITQVPRLEIMFEEEGLILRILLLNIPGIDLIYDVTPDRVITMDTKAGDMSQLAPDLAHCAELCRIHYCTVMSFCRYARTCLISSEQIEDNNKLKSKLSEEKDVGCNTYSQPLEGYFFQPTYFHELQLHGIIARYQHQDYSLTNVPKMPDEIAMPIYESGISNQDYSQAKNDYLDELMKFISTNDAPELTIRTNIADRFIVLVPTNFEVENDPLSDFDLYDDDKDNYGNDDKPYAFHQGLNMYRYNTNPTTTKVANLRTLNGLSYDQCAMACLDSKCGTFSYCDFRHECIISDVNNTGRAQTLDLVTMDPDCFIAQRDFLSNFVQFKNVYQPQLYSSMSSSIDPSECALNCFAETTFRCLAFDFCSRGKSGVCYYHKNRNAGHQNMQSIELDGSYKETGCDHYSRSFLADFNRVEYRRVASQEIFKLKTTEVAGQSVFRCAEMCVNELIDCTAFQFCLNTSSPGAKQECIMIESRPQDANRSDFSAVVDEKSGELVQAGKYLEHDINCQVFSLRKDSSEAHLRDLALGGVTTVQELAEETNKSKSSGPNLFLLFVIVSLVSTALGCGLCFLKDNNEYLRQRFDSVRMRIGL